MEVGIIDLFKLLRQNKGRGEVVFMTNQPKHETVRLTVDFPIEQHKYIKMMAAKEGVSMRQFIIEHLPAPELKKPKKSTVKKTKFNKLLDDIITDYEDELRSLSKR